MSKSLRSCDDMTVRTAFPRSNSEAASLTCQYRDAFGWNLHQARVAANLTLEEVATISGFSASCLRKIEAGQYEPRLKTIAILAHVVGCKPWTLFTLGDRNANNAGACAIVAEM